MNEGETKTEAGGKLPAFALIGQSALMGYEMAADMKRGGWGLYDESGNRFATADTALEAWQLAVTHMQAQPGYVAPCETREEKGGKLPTSCVLIEPAILEAMIEALCFYAEPAVYVPTASGDTQPIWEDTDGVAIPGYVEDAPGAKARAALVRLEGSKS